MEFVILGFFTALGKLVILHKFFGLSKVLYFEKWVDLFFCLLLPVLFWGTFSGAILAVFSGLWLSGMLRFARIFCQPTKPEWMGGRKSYHDKRKIR